MTQDELFTAIYRASKGLRSVRDTLKNVTIDAIDARHDLLGRLPDVYYNLGQDAQAIQTMLDALIASGTVSDEVLNDIMSVPID